MERSLVLRQPYHAYPEQELICRPNRAVSSLRVAWRYACEYPAEALLRRVLPISTDEVLCDVRGFDCKRPAQRLRLEEIGRTFLNGYHAALRAPEVNLEEQLDRVELEVRGFAYEGAAMALGLMDSLLPVRRRLSCWVAGPGQPHSYMSMVGLGWAYARLPWKRRRIEKVAAGFDPLLWPLVLDGFGFHEGYFYSRAYLNEGRYPSWLSGAGRHPFDQGLGRSLWFSQGAEALAIGAVIRSFAPDRSADLWSGVGLACGYAGWLTETDARNLREIAGPHRAALAQGTAFAAKARQRAGNLTEHTSTACRVLCGASAESAALVTDQALADISRCSYEAPYREWVLLLRKRFEQL